MLTITATLVTVLVGLNTLVVSCSSERYARAQKTTQIAESKERFWRDMYRDLSDALGMAPGPGREARILVLSQLLESRKAEDEPTFIRYRDRFESLLFTSITPEERARVFETEAKELDFSQKQSRSSEGAVINPESQKVVEDPKELPAMTRLIQLTPPSDKHWDLDIFWCQGKDENDRRGLEFFNNALRVGEALKSVSKDGAELAGQRLGRIRIRMLPIGLQGSSRYMDNARDLVIRYNGPEERKLAEALRESQPGRLDFRIGASKSPTPWYLSMFICKSTVTNPPAQSTAQSASGTS